MEIESIFSFLISVAFLTFSAAAWYSIKDGINLEKWLIVEGGQLSTQEEERLDRILEAGKKYYNTSVVLAFLLLGISSIEEFLGLELPIGAVTFPQINASLGLHAVVVLLLIASERMFLMALPWMKLDKRRTPYDWVILGLAFNTTYRVGAWFYIPITVSSIGLSIVLNSNNIAIDSMTFAMTFGTLSILSTGLTYMPKPLYFLNHLISTKQDHRGGEATFSMYLLYCYRFLRQIIVTFFMAYPFVLIMPNWEIPEYTDFLGQILPYVITLYGIRILGWFKSVYKVIDRIGGRLGFPRDSPHY